MSYPMPNEDAYWERRREEYEHDPVVTTCECCGVEITESDALNEGYYDIDGEHICFDCLHDYFKDSLKHS